MSGRWTNYSEVDDVDLEFDDLDLEDEWDDEGAVVRGRARPPRKRTDGEIELGAFERDSKRNKPRRQAPPHKRREELC
jgi:hypothetical protein